MMSQQELLVSQTLKLNVGTTLLSCPFNLTSHFLQQFNGLST